MKNIKELFDRCLSIPYIHIDENAADYAYEIEDGILYIYFECSSEKEDWKNNFSFWTKPYRDMDIKWYCHSGYLKVWKTIQKALDINLFINAKQVVIVGYSHGAALASLCHEWVWFNFPHLRSNMKGYGFGAPRVYRNWFWRFPKRLKVRWKDFTVVKNRSDIVTHVPFAILGFRHVGKMLKIKNKNFTFPIKSHYPEEYQKSLEEYLNKK